MHDIDMEYKRVECDFGTIDVYRCRTCGVVVDDPDTHQRWAASLKIQTRVATPGMIEHELLPDYEPISPPRTLLDEAARWVGKHVSCKQLGLFQYSGIVMKAEVAADDTISLVIETPEGQTYVAELGVQQVEQI